jgi:16S rRNA (guanine(1405)-N(7))-methyltransferase
MAKAPDRDSIVEALARAPKYRGLCRDTLTRTADWALARHTRDRDALKAAKRKLHQIYGAYIDQGDSWRKPLADALADPAAFDDPEAVRRLCRAAIDRHASTAERLTELAQVYAELFALAGAPDRVLDLACGLNPLTVPWMPAGRPRRYRAFDIDGPAIELLDRVLQRIHPDYRACWADVLAAPPSEPADLALLLKAVPCLEQQDKGASERLIRSLNVRHVALSFPLRSLGGRAKGMEQTYTALAEDLIARLGVEARSLRRSNELFYVLDLRTAGAGS